jgi:hypothetical protein
MAIQSPLGNRATTILDFIGNAFGMKDEEEKRRQAGAVVGAPIQQPSLKVGPMQFGEPQNMEQLQVQQQMQEQNARMPQIGQQTAVKLPDLGTKETELKAADAAVRQMAAGGDQDPGFMDKVKNYFGDEGNMLRLAMAFNTMRLNPDQQLAAYAAKRLETLQKGKVAAGGARAIAQQLYKMGYKDYAEQALRNPSMASTIYEQVIQKDLAPGAADTISGVQYDKDNRAYIVRTPKNGGEPTVQYLGTTRTGPEEVAAIELEANNLQEQWKLSIKRSDEAMEKASNVSSMLNDYQAALLAIQNGAEAGFIRSKLPAFDAQTALLQNAASRLGIGVINSATFGALSQSELDLALKQSIDLSLSTTPDPVTGISPLEEQIIAKMKATEKLYSALVDQAAEMASMPYGEYTKLMKERKAENAKYTKKPEGVTDQQWYAMTLDQKKRFYEAGEK